MSYPTVTPVNIEVRVLMLREYQGRSELTQEIWLQQGNANRLHAGSAGLINRY